MATGRRTSLEALQSQVNDQTRHKWKQAFAAFDLRKTGAIDADELSSVMRSMKMIPHPGEVDAMISAADHDGDRQINYDEFELMMISAGRGDPGAKFGFSHIVQRHITMSDVSRLIIDECTGFVDRFCRDNVPIFSDIPLDGSSEYPLSFFDTFKQFQEEAELVMQNVLILWGVASQKSFDPDFLDTIQESNLLEEFLSLTEFEHFVNRMRAYAQQHKHGIPLDGIGLVPQIPRPMTPHTRQKTQQRLAEIDMQLAGLDAQRNKLLVERRRIIGCEVGNVTTTCLKQELLARRWREDVGWD